MRVLCPGLFGIDGSALGGRSDETGRATETPALDRLLARADACEAPGRDPLETLAAAFELAPAPGTDLPSAALCLLVEAPERLAGAAAGGAWFHADPVHLHPDRDRLVLYGGPGLALAPEESDALVGAFNDHFADDRLRLVATGPGRWYLHVPEPPRLVTRPLHAVSGRALDGCLPEGPDARAWARWQNEAQMLFFAHPASRAREAAGRPVVNGIWTWGGGALPRVDTGPDLVVADHPFALGLAQAAGRQTLPLDALDAGLRALGSGTPGRVLVFWDRARWPALEGDGDAWRAAVGGLEAAVSRLLEAMRVGALGRLVLDDGECRRFVLDRRGLRRFWRRRGGLAERLAALSGGCGGRGRGVVSGAVS